MIVSEALFDYRWRISARARSVWLRVTVEHGLEVILPRGVDPAEIPVVLSKKARWIRRALNRIEAQRAALPVPAPWRLPDEIQLPAIARTWRVTAQPMSSSPGEKGVVITEVAPALLHINGRTDDAAACGRALRRWLKSQAELHVTPLLRDLSEALGLRYRRVSYRYQRTRWGSCSRRGVINLNVKLLFLTPPMMRYVLIHELCHLREMNHSRRFWDLVRSFDADSGLHDRALREGWRYVPAWAKDPFGEPPDTAT